MEQAEAGGHRDAAPEDQQETDPMDDGEAPAKWALPRPKPDAGGENHSAQAQKNEHDADEMTEFDERVIHNDDTPDTLNAVAARGN